MAKASVAVSDTSYPRVCVRIIGGVYHWLPVKAVDEAPSEAPRMGRTLEFLDPTPGWPTEWHQLRCEALVERAEELCRAQGKSVCVVFGPKDAVYLETHLPRKQSDEPPWGGVGAGGASTRRSNR